MRKYGIFFLLSFLLVGCHEQAPLGTIDNPIKLYFTPSVDADSITTNSREFIQYLEKQTGLIFKTGIPTNYVAVVEAFGSKRADIGVMNSFGYIMANQKYGANAFLRVIRHGHNYYQGQIIAHVDSGINEVKDLQGTKFAFTDPSSTSGYMFPLKILKENNVKPKNTMFATKHDNVVTMIYQKQVDAGATYYSPPTEDGTIRDARARVKTQFPDVEDKVKIITTTEQIPNDPFVFRKDLPQPIIDKFIKAVKSYLQTEAGREVFNKIYSVEGVVDTTNEDYDGLREMIKSINIDASKLIK